jgi:hypothetical protein
MITKFIGDSSSLEYVDKIGIAYLNNGVLFESEISTYTPDNSVFNLLILVDRVDDKFTYNVPKGKLLKINNIIYYNNGTPIGYSSLGYTLDTNSYGVEVLTIELNFNTTTSTYEIELSTDYTKHISSVAKQHKKLLTDNLYANKVDIESVERKPLTGCTLSDMMNGSMVRYSGDLMINSRQLFINSLRMDTGSLGDDDKDLDGIITLGDYEYLIMHYKATSGTDYGYIRFTYNSTMDIYLKFSLYKLYLESVEVVGSNLIIVKATSDLNTVSSYYLLNIPEDLYKYDGNSISLVITPTKLDSRFNKTCSKDNKVGIWYVKNSVTDEVYFYKYDYDTRYITSLSKKLSDILLDLGFDRLSISASFDDTETSIDISDTIIGLTDTSMIYSFTDSDGSGYTYYRTIRTMNGTLKDSSGVVTNDFQLDGNVSNLRILGNESIIYTEGGDVYVAYVDNLNYELTLQKRQIGVKNNDKYITDKKAIGNYTLYGSDFISTHIDNKLKYRIDVYGIIHKGCLYTNGTDTFNDKFIIAI